MLNVLFRQKVTDENRASLHALIGAPPELTAVVGSIAIEKRYVDADYRDLYYHYFAGKYREWQRDCQRIHMWDVEGAYLGAVVRSFDPYDSDYPWRPFKYDISPCWLAGGLEPWYLLATKRRLHAIDEEYDLRRFPSIAQDGEYTRCAHAALWNVLTYLADKYHIYKARRPTEILELSAKWTYERSFPSHGLFPEEMSSVLLGCGLYPRIYTAVGTEEARCDYDLPDLLDVYLDSGFPILVGIEKRKPKFFTEKPGRKRWNKPPEGEGHAVVVVGHNYTPKAHFSPKRPALAYRHRSAYLVVDDNEFPYSQMQMKPKGDYRVRITYGKDRTGKTRFNCIDDIIVPLPLRIGVFAEHVLGLLSFFGDAEANNLGMGTDADYADIAFRPFLMSAGSYRRLMLKLYGPTLYPAGGAYLKTIGMMPLPHFVWVVEVVSRASLREGDIAASRMVYGHIVLDASAKGLNTAAGYDRSPELLLNVGAKWTANDIEGDQYKTWTPPAAIQSKPHFPFMCHNLRDVRSAAFKTKAEP